MVTLDVCSDTVRKVATTSAEAGRLAREARVLAAARHPGVVQLTAARPRTLEVRAVTGWCLSDIGALHPLEVAGIGCALATTLSDLHQLGIVHGAVEPSHILVERKGRPILCSLGRARLPGADEGPDSTDDVVALIALLSSLLGPSSDIAAAGVRRALATRRWLGRRRHPTAQQLATRLAAVPGSVLPDPADRVSSRPAGLPVRADPNRRRMVLGATGAAVAVAVAVVAVAAAGVGLFGGGGGVATMGGHCPKVDLGCGPVARNGGIVVADSVRFRVGGAGDDPVVLGRWTCGPALPAVLRLDRGEVWIWDRWPHGHSAVSGRLAGRVDGAKTLRVVPGSGGCDQLAVIGPGGVTTNMS